MENEKLIYSKMIAIMAEVGSIGKSGRNKEQGYAYRSIDDVIAALQPLLSKHGVLVVPEVLKFSGSERETKKGTVLIYADMDVKYTFYAADGSSVTATMHGQGMDTGDKASNKALSAAYKYMLTEVFAIPTSDAKDSEIDHHEIIPEKKEHTKSERAELCSELLRLAMEKQLSEKQHEFVAKINQHSDSALKKAIEGMKKLPDKTSKPDSGFQDDPKFDEREVVSGGV